MTGDTRRLFICCGSLFLLAMIAAGLSLGPALSTLFPARLSFPPPPEDIQSVLFAYSTLPRLAMAPLCGIALGLAGTLFQQVLRNPLASPSTLGVEAGAGLGLAVATLYMPGLLGWSRDLVALGGAGIAAGLVFLLAGRFGFRPLAIILAGLITGFYLSAVTSTFTLLNEFQLSGLFIWGAGSLSQQDWRPFLALLPRILICAVAAVLLIRPLTALQLDEAARSLGLRLSLVRAAALLIAVALAAFTVSAVGVIGFLGLAAPAIARAAGARRFSTRIWAAPLIGGLLLTATDQFLQLLTAKTGLFFPAGAVTAMLGAPLLLLLVRRMKTAVGPAPNGAPLIAARANQRPFLFTSALILYVAILAAGFLGRDASGGWVVDLGDQLSELLVWRLPRTVAAASAGAMLAVAGVVLQRLMRNPMASPEVLGVNAGAGFGLLAVLIFIPAAGSLALTLGAATGALAALALLLLAIRHAGLARDHALLAGIALATFLLSMLAIVTASGDPRALLLLNWMAGSTYRVDSGTAAFALFLACAMLPILSPISRQLELLAPGTEIARAAGMRVERFQLLALCFAGLLSAAASLIVGPLSFVGLLAPQIARQAGLRRPGTQLAGAVLSGAALMGVADVIGRTAYFPWQLPAGLICTLLGGPVLALILLKRFRSR